MCFAAEEPIGDAAVEMNVSVEGRAEALQEGYCAEARTGQCAGTNEVAPEFLGFRGGSGLAITYFLGLSVAFRIARLPGMV